MDVSINGPKILFTLPVLGGINITESVVHAWLVMALIVGACLWLTKDLSVQNPGKKQIIAEKLVLMVRGLVDSNMGSRWAHFVPYIGTLFAFSFVSSVLSVTGLRSPTADFSVTLAMALVTFVLIEYYYFKNKGFFGFFKRLTEPIIVMTPMNLVSEVATPLSLALRHFGNIASGAIITTLVYGALTALSGFVLGWIPNTFIASIPIMQIGLPAVLSIYFDLFSSAIQAYIFVMLTMANIAGTAD
ncbi:MAG: F0F1 ATP synthase subunit A [Oscillospiraceae bacterium]|nr:F0F1 ATP synthase subunit A [Oscillospiraceae bacterium]MBQ6851354.1 F0F1 ATP synthase subunit A [Oscillospiraceae bacterium]MBR6609899.1 F0F1 ATP synthase subunit A [Oscillospiraceae bacterium]